MIYNGLVTQIVKIKKQLTGDFIKFIKNREYRKGINWYEKYSYDQIKIRWDGNIVDFNSMDSWRIIEIRFVFNPETSKFKLTYFRHSSGGESLCDKTIEYTVEEVLEYVCDKIQE